MNRPKLPPAWIVALLGRIGQNRYSIVGPGGQFGDVWAVCQYRSLGLFECSEKPVAISKNLYEAMLAAFPELRVKYSEGHPRWNPNHWRKGKYVGPDC